MKLADLTTWQSICLSLLILKQLTINKLRLSIAA
jgi:hypothetical protein